MRVLFVSHKFPPQKGGVGVSALRIVEGLSAWCEQVHVLHATRDLSPGSVQSREEGRATVFTMGETERGAESGQLLETTIRALHQKFGYHVVIGFYAVPTGFTAVFTAKFLGLPSILCLRGNDMDRALYHGGQLDALIWALRQADAVLGVSRESIHKTAVLSGRQDGCFIANSVDSEIFRPLDREVEPRSMLFTGEMRLKKGSEVLLAILPTLDRDWSLTVVGGFRGAAESEFRRWSVRERRSAAKVRLLPYARDTQMLVELYNRADLVLNPALWDGMPNSVLEAMACGRPVLTTRVGGIPDLVEDGVNGYLLDLAELGQLGMAIEKIFDDPQRSKVGRAARDHVVAQHHPRLESQAFREVLERVVSV